MSIIQPYYIASYIYMLLKGLVIFQTSHYAIGIAATNNMIKSLW